ncbi:MAG: hypothetical protein AB9891_13070 [Anaerolineaceae bacterium]
MIEPQTAILLMRLILSPALIACATLIGRKWGPSVSGWFTGFPFISAPISLILAVQNGTDYAVQAAIGTLGGQSCVCLFAVLYFFASRRWGWWLSSLTAIAFFLLAAYGWRAFSPGLWPALFLLLLITIGSLRLPMASREQASKSPAPWWDLTARMIIACVMVFSLTGVSALIGARWSGILSAFPVFGLILAAFTHMQQGPDAVGQLLRGSILGSFGIAIFYALIAVFLPMSGSLWVYLAAGIGSVLVNWFSLKSLVGNKPSA